MKKIISIGLCAIYLVLVSGVAFQLHYCGGKFSSVNLTLLHTSNSCPCGSKTMKKGCCKNQSVYVIIKADQNSSNNILSFNSIQDITIALPAVKTNLLKVPFETSIKNYHEPPPKFNNSLLILNSVFRL